MRGMDGCRGVATSWQHAMANRKLANMQWSTGRAVVALDGSKGRVAAGVGVGSILRHPEAWPA